MNIMKRLFYLITFTAVTLLAFSCEQAEPLEPVVVPTEQEETPGQDNPDQPSGSDAVGNIVFTADREDLGGEAKSTIAGGGAVSWESGDAISILWTGGRTTSTTTDSGASASFSAEVDETASGGTYYSVYPSSVATELTETDVLSVTIPSNQDGTFSSANINVAKTTSTSFSFKAIGNVIKFSVTDSDVTKMRIYSWDKTPLVGTCSVNVSGATPTVSGYTSTSSEIEVTIDGAGTYYAVVLPGTHAEGLLFAPETSSSYKRAAYAEKSWTAARKAVTNFGAVQSHARDLYVSASGSGKGLAMATPMSPATFKSLLEQQSDGDDAERYFHLLYGSTITVQDNIAIDEVRVEFGSSFKSACQFSITGASASTEISPAETNRLFRFSNNTNVTISDITLTGGSADNGGAIEIDNGSTGPATVTCSNVTFSSNTASNNGGAVSLTGRGKPASFIANGCTFSGNSAGSRGGVVYQSAGNNSQAGNSISSFTDCIFTGNNATTNAGVMQVYRGTATFSGDNVFTANTSATGGVFHVNGVGILDVTGGTFGASGDSSYDNANKATGTGDGAAVLYYEAGSASFSGSTFQYNQSAKNGGVVTSKGNGSCVFENCSFLYNNAISNGGVAYLTNNSVLTLTGCTASHNSAVSGGIAQIYKGTLTVNGSSSYDHNSASTGGGVFYLNYSTATLNLSDGEFSSNTAPNGAVGHISSGTINVTGSSTFNSNTTAGAGGVFYLDKSDSNLNATGSRFTNNVARNSSGTGSDTNNTGAGICAISSSTVDLNSCYFYNNRAGNTDNTDSKEYGGAICIKGASVSATLCNFHGNKGNRGSVVFMENGGGLFKADRCSFHGNKQYSRGVIYVLANNVAMFNQCAFYGEDLRGTSSCWGESLQGANAATAICVNNCSFNSTKTSYSKNICAINTDGALLVTNSSLIGTYPATGVIRPNNANAVLVNNVIINRTSSNNSINSNGTTPTSLKYNTLGAAYSIGGTLDPTNATGASESSFTWTPDSGADDAMTLWKGWFTWSGSSQGATVTAITDAYTAFSVDVSSYGGVLGSMTHVGNAFKDWLDSFDPDAYTVNQRGIARAAQYWPGSCQN